jgi:choline transport protein
MESLHVQGKRLSRGVDDHGVRDLANDAAIFDNAISNVPERYHGTSADAHDMAMLGKKQVLRRNFNFITMLGFASTCIASWEGVLTYLGFVLTDGGTPLLFWGFIACAIGQTLVYASLAEMASMSPTAGGQYHWVSEFAPPRWQKVLSYYSGWLTAIGWQVSCRVKLVSPEYRLTSLTGLLRKRLLPGWNDYSRSYRTK